MLRKGLLALALAATASAANAQGRRGTPPLPPMGPEIPPIRGGGLASLLLDARRELNLSPKQLLALDSLERQEFAQRRQRFESIRARRDSLCKNRQPCELTREERTKLFGTADESRGRRAELMRTDSLKRSRIFGMLDTTQRRLAERLEDRREIRGYDRPSRRLREVRRYERRYGDRDRGYRERAMDRRYRDRRMMDRDGEDRFGPEAGPPRWREDRPTQPDRRRARPGEEDGAAADSSVKPSAKK